MPELDVVDGHSKPIVGLGYNGWLLVLPAYEDNAFPHDFLEVDVLLFHRDHVAVKHVHIGIRLSFFDSTGVLDRCRATDRAAASFLVTGVDALNEHHVLLVFDPTGLQHALELQLGHDVRGFPIHELAGAVDLNHACGHDNGVGMEFLGLAVHLHGHRVVADVALHVRQLGVCEDLDVVPAVDLGNQSRLHVGCDVAFGGYGTDGIQETTQFGLTFHQIHLEALVGYSRGGSHAGSTTPDDQAATPHGQLDLVPRLQEARLGHTHLNEVFGLLCGNILVVAVNPRDLFPRTDELQLVGVHAGFGHGLPEKLLMGPRRAAGYNHTVEVILDHRLLHAVQEVNRADPLPLLRGHHTGEAFREVPDFAAANRALDIGAAVADKDAYARLFLGSRPSFVLDFSLVAHAPHLVQTAFMPAAVACATDSEISMGPVAPPAK
ncbi:MAG: hypothetical protein BWY79_00745 [Actinobacteria bacterium ADurb.Bin444]|nr:MAG: hypothetical protein BWY79_00745 [Actinobacteria bacterium ADurb.Bin444]